MNVDTIYSKKIDTVVFLSFYGIRAQQVSLAAISSLAVYTWQVFLPASWWTLYG